MRPETGEYVWHYQTTPGESWDYTATQHIILADLPIDGATRKVLMQAPKNGFFYVLDRATGELLSATPYVPINWATGVDMTTGRPIENPEARYLEKPMLVKPSYYGGHNWQPMAFNPKTGLVYIPTLDIPMAYGNDAGFRFRPGQTNIGIDLLVVALPGDVATRRAIKSMLKGDLIAWDPVAQKEAWRVALAGPGNGGVLATAGNLVFQGTADKRFVAYRADTGEKLWETPTQSGVVAAPMSYEIDGVQYVAVMAGWGGALPLVSGALTANSGANQSRLLVYKLGGRSSLPVPPVIAVQHPAPPPAANDEATLTKGKWLYQANCLGCHADSAQGNNVLPDLRWSPMLEPTAWKAVVFDGGLKAKGMIGFDKFLGESDVEAIRAYVVSEARNEL